MLIRKILESQFDQSAFGATLQPVPVAAKLAYPQVDRVRARKRRHRTNLASASPVGGWSIRTW